MELSPKMQARLQGLFLANEAVMIDDKQSVLKHSRDVAEQHMKRFAGIQPSANGDGMGINIGDVNHNYPSLPPATGGKVGTLAKLAIGAGLLATGVGAGAGGLAIFNALMNRPTTTAPTPGDGNSKFDLRIVNPDK